MDFNIFIHILIAAIAAGTPFVYAALGELITEKSGVLNLGVEGMMLVGAISGFIAMAKTGSLLMAVLCGMTAGALMAGIFAVLTLTLMANQVASGLALTIFGVGLREMEKNNHPKQSFYFHHTDPFQCNQPSHKLPVLK